MVRPYMNTSFQKVVFGKGMNVDVSASLQHMSAAYVSLLLACLPIMTCGTRGQPADC